MANYGRGGGCPRRTFGEENVLESVKPFEHRSMVLIDREYGVLRCLIEEVDRMAKNFLRLLETGCQLWESGGTEMELSGKSPERDWIGGRGWRPDRGRAIRGDTAFGLGGPKGPRGLRLGKWGIGVSRRRSLEGVVHRSDSVGNDLLEIHRMFVRNKSLLGDLTRDR